MGGMQTKGNSIVKYSCHQLCGMLASHIYPLGGVSPSRLHFQHFRRGYRGR